MRLYQLIDTPESPAPTALVCCTKCGRPVSLNKAVMDLDGPAYKAYYHEHCLDMGDANTGEVFDDD